MRWTNDRWISTLHRVATGPAKDSPVSVGDCKLAKVRKQTLVTGR
jgi:hypothetical protein